MSQHYYADGAKHYDRHREMNINISGGASDEQLMKIAKGFFTDDEGDEYCDFEEIKETPKPSLSKADKLRFCIERLEREGVIAYKSDYAVIKKVIKDKGFDSLTNEEFCSLVCSLDCVPDDHKPSVSSIKMVVFRNTIYPSIEIADAKQEKNIHIKQVADLFCSIYESM